MRRVGVVLDLTHREARMVMLCLNGEIENDDGGHGDYMNALRRVLRKLAAQGISLTGPVKP